MPAVQFLHSKSLFLHNWLACLVFAVVFAAGVSAQQPGANQANDSAQRGRTGAGPARLEGMIAGQQGAGSRGSLGLQRQVNIQQPPGFPLTQEMDDYVGQLLDHWQKMSDQVKAYRCDFTRWDYDASQVDYRDAQNRPAAYLVAQGQVRYAAKDRAMFETNKMWRFAGPPEQPGGEAKYEPTEGYPYFGKTMHERWSCDGQAIYEYDFENKRINQTNIPPEMQGNVVESPLPFLFGANKQDVLTRYWVRYVPKYKADANGQQQLVRDEYWLEAFPKTVKDARMYSKLEIILAADTFMPKAIHMYDPNYDPSKNNLSSRNFYFENREVNGQLDRFKDFMKVFVKPRPAPGWKIIETMGSAGPNTATAPEPGTRLK